MKCNLCYQSDPCVRLFNVCSCKIHASYYHTKCLVKSLKYIAQTERYPYKCKVCNCQYNLEQKTAWNFLTIIATLKAIGATFVFASFIFIIVNSINYLYRIDLIVKFFTIYHYWAYLLASFCCYKVFLAVSNYSLEGLIFIYILSFNAYFSFSDSILSGCSDKMCLLKVFGTAILLMPFTLIIYFGNIKYYDMVNYIYDEWESEKEYAFQRNISIFYKKQSGVSSLIPNGNETDYDDYDESEEGESQSEYESEEYL